MANKTIREDKKFTKVVAVNSGTPLLADDGLGLDVDPVHAIVVRVRTPLVAEVRNDSTNNWHQVNLLPNQFNVVNCNGADLVVFRNEDGALSRVVARVKPYKMASKNSGYKVLSARCDELEEPKFQWFDKIPVVAVPA
jgi:hypothetical protein